MRMLLATNPDYNEFVMKELIQKYAHTEHTFRISLGKISFQELSQEPYDVGVSFMYQHRVPKEQLDKPWFNFHPAPLPQYKGRNLCYHAIVNGELFFGASLHYMDENFDTGDIIDVRKFPIQDWMTAEDLYREAISLSGKMFIDYLPRILAGEDFLRYPNHEVGYYKKEPIPDVYKGGDPFCSFVRAVTFGDFVPKVDIGGILYKVVKA